MSWESVRLGDIATFSNGVNFGKEAYGAGVKLIGVSDFGDRYYPDYSTLSEVNPDVVRDYALLNPGDIVFVRSNGNKALVGRCMLLTDECESVTFSGFCIRARLNDTNRWSPRFFTYYFKSDEFRKSISSSTAGTNIQNLNQGILSSHVALLPEYETQCRIADILDQYNNLIENNRRQIALLEEAAQRLYKEWFVDLRFPGHEDIEIVDGIPDGWQIVQIRDVCKKIQSGGTPSRKKASFWDPGTVKWFKTGELQDCWLIEPEELISDDGLAGSAAKLFPPLTIVMAIYASPTLGRLGVLNCEAAFNQAMLGFIVNEGVTTRDWLYWKLYELRTEFNSIARGAGQQNISGEIVKSYEVLLPPRALAQKFSDVVGPMAERRLKLQEQNLTVGEARERLLPKLMSGEIEV